MLLGVIVISGVAVLGASDTVAASNPTVISECQEINLPGEYVLEDDLTPSSPGAWETNDACLIINSSSVTLDGMGHTINGSAVDVDDTRGILVRNESRSGDRDDSSTWLTDVTVRNVTFEHWDQSVRAVGVDDVLIENVISNYDEIFTHGNYDDIFVRHGSNLEIRDVTAIEAQIGRTVYLDAVSTAIVDGVTVERDFVGQDGGVIEIEDSANVEITNAFIDDGEASSIGSVTTNEMNAIRVSGTDMITITGNDITGVGHEDYNGYGIIFTDEGSATDAILSQNEISGPEGTGIKVRLADGTEIVDNEITAGSGIVVDGADEVTIAENTLSDVTRTGISVANSLDIVVRDTDISTDRATAGISVDDASRGKFERIGIDGDPHYGVDLLSTNNELDEFLSFSELTIEDGDIRVDRRNNWKLSDSILEGGQIDYAGGYGDVHQNVTIVDVEVKWPYSSASIVLDRANGVTLENVTARDGTQQGLVVDGSSGVNVHDFTITGQDGADEFAFVALTDSDNLSMDGLNVSFNPATVQDGWSSEKGILYVDGISDSRIANLTAIDNTVWVPAVRIDAGENVSLADAVISTLNDDFTQIDAGATEIQGSNFTIGYDAPTEVTFSFEGAGIHLGEAEDPPSHPDTTSIDYLRVVPIEGADNPYLDLSIHYNDEAVLDENSLALFYYAEDGTWTGAPSTALDVDHDTITTSVTEFPEDFDETEAVFGVFAGASAELEIVSTDVSRDTVGVGESITVFVDIENTGDVAGEFTADLLIDGEVVDTKSETFDPGDTGTILFDPSFDEPGSYDIQVEDTMAGTVHVEAGILRFVVTNEDGEPLADVGVGPMDLGQFVGTTDDSGVYETYMPPGEHNIYANLPVDGTETRFDVNVEADETTVEEFVDSTDQEEEGPDSTPSPSPSPANFDVSIDTWASTLDVTLEDSLTVVAEIENTGEESATQTVTMTLGDITRTESVHLRGGEGEAVSFSIDPVLAYDGEQVLIETADTTSTETASVRAPGPAHFEVTIDAGESIVNVDAGENITLVTDVTNTGDEAATQPIESGIQSLAAIQYVTLDPGETERITFEYSVDDADVGQDATIRSHDAVATIPLEIRIVDTAYFEVKVDAEESDLNVDGGDRLTVATDVTNIGETSGTQSIALVDEAGTVLASTTLDLEPDETDAIELHWDTDPADFGYYGLTVQSQNASDPASATVRGIVAARSIEGAEAFPGETIEVTIDVQAIGGADFTIEEDLAGLDDVTIVESDGAVASTLSPQGTVIAHYAERESATLTFEGTVPVDAASGSTHSLSGTVDTDDGAMPITGDEMIEVVQPSVERTITPTERSPGETAVVTVTVEHAGDRTVTFVENFEPFDTITLRDENDVEFAGVAPDENSVIATAVADGSAQLSYEVTIPSGADEAYHIDGTVEIGDLSLVPNGDDTIDVTGDGGVVLANEASPFLVDQATGLSSATFSEASAVKQVTLHEDWSGYAVVTEYEDLPADLDNSPNNPLSVVRITVPDGAEDTDATLVMQIDRATLSVNDVGAADLEILHYTGEEWKPLETNVVEETDDSVLLEAETDGFSVFVIDDPSTHRSSVGGKTVLILVGLAIGIAIAGYHRYARERKSS